ncbi:Las1-like-domain-containing protein [Sordaria brevicollis]|uniref:Las1-like-domain-containing protein n=1 Tax=Sordaria brevicollis TaxID=83679 RepID=A0AAE0PP71_SORBR|nr:Las1-like-domain-containing protein [Sordaria brevicollis]
MVQYIFTPWRDRRELLAVRRQFYPHQYESQAPTQPPQQLQRGGGAAAAAGAKRKQTQTTQRTTRNKRARTDDGNGNQAATSSASAQPSDPVNENGGQQDQRRLAVARVSMWMQRGNCPHMVESTALLMAAILSDEEQTGISSTTTSSTSTGMSTARGVDGIGVMSSSYAVRAAYSAAFSRFVTGLLDSHQDKTRKMSMYGVAKSVGLPATFVELRHQATHEQLPSLTRLRTAAKKGLEWIWEYYWKHLPEVDDESQKRRDGEVIMLDEDEEDKAGEGEGEDEGEDDGGPAWRLYKEDEWMPKPIGVV